MILAGICWLSAVPAAAEYSVQPVPRVLPYQGSLDQDGKPFTGDASMTFKLFASQTDCEAATQPAADWSASKTVPVRAGRFAVVLGEAPDPLLIPDALFRAAEVFLSIQVEAVRLDKCQVLRPVAYAQRSAGDVPIGTVIDWWRPNVNVSVPDGYAICDGSLINEPRSPLDGESSPNLVGKFVRGVGDPSDIGTGGGSDDLPSYTVTVAGFSGNFTAAAAGSGHRHRWAYFTADEDWFSWDGSGVVRSMISWDNGLDGEGVDIFPMGHDGYTGAQLDYYTDPASTQGEHTHSVSGNHGHTASVNPSSGTGANLPSYMGLLKLIRIY